MRLKLILALITTLGIVADFPTVALAQSGTGVYPYGAYDSLGFDTINVGNLNVHFALPIINKPGRGQPFYYNLAYDGLVWTPVTVSGTTVWTLAQAAGWTAQTAGTTGYLTYTTTNTSQRVGSGICVTSITKDYVYYDPFGVGHAFPAVHWTTKAGSCSGSSGVSGGTAVDGSGYSMGGVPAAAHVTTKGGRSFVPPFNQTTGAASVTDLNGNEITNNGNGDFTDTLGLTALAITGSQSSSQQFAYTDTTGTSRNVTVNYSTYTLQTAFGCSGVSDYGPQSTQLISSIVFPDGSSYSFTYEPTPGAPSNVTGRIASVTLPAGGKISYAYTGANNGISCTDGGPAGLTRTLSNDPAGSIRTYSRTISGSSISTAAVDGLGNHLNYAFVATSVGPYETERKDYNGSSGTAVLDRVTCYNGTIPGTCQSTVPTLPVTQTDTYETADGLVTRGSTITYDSYGDITEETDYDYGTQPNRGSVLRVETISGYGTQGAEDEPTSDLVQDGSGHTLSSTTYSYDKGTLTATSGLPQHVAVTSARGNLTGIIQANGTAGATTTYEYDDAGQVRTAIDNAGNSTSYTYDNSYDAYLTQTSLPTVNGVTQTTTMTPDFNTGLPLSTMTNGILTVSYTYNSMLQPLTASYTGGGSVSWTYSPIGNVGTNTPATSSVSVLHAGSSQITQSTTLDWYGRTKETSLTDSGGNDLTDTSYDANGNVATVSNPYRSGGTEVYTTYGYDVLSRQVSIKEPDCSGSTCSTQTSAPSGNATLLTDEAGHMRELFVDGLGRLTKVLEENPSNTTLGLETDYAYYQNYSTQTYQTTVTQQGAAASSQWRNRTFTYDMLGRVVSETSPEAGTTSYSYPQTSSPCAGDPTKVCSRTDARGVVTTYSYDALSRLTGISYNTTGTTAAATPSVAYYYDQSSYNGLSISDGVGQRTGMSDGSGETAWSFNPLGQVTATRKTLNSVTKQANFTYNPDGTLNTLQDFGGTTFTYSYTGAGLPNGITDQTGFNWASNGTYNAAGQLTGMQNQLSTSSPLVRTIAYNNRLQPASIIASYMSYPKQVLYYTYGTVGQNNGNISYIENDNPCCGRNQTFTYDNLNRVITAGDASNWGESYTYDAWGNMTAKTITRGTGYSFSVTANANNQLSNLTYDAAGEVTTDQLGNTYTYNAEGRIVTAGSGTYTYDGDGNRVSKADDSGTTLYWPSSVNGVIDESNSSATSFGRQIYLGNLHIYSEDTSGNGRYLLQDHLGSTRVTVALNADTLDDLDYRAFGDIVANYGGAPSDNHYVFTGYESDASDSSTDYGQYRNLGVEMGRFTRPDPYDGSYDPTNPQSLNRYSYVKNNPLSHTDILGLDGTDEDADSCDDDITCFYGDGGGGGGSADGSNGSDPNNPGGCGSNPNCVSVGGGVPFDDTFVDTIGYTSTSIISSVPVAAPNNGTPQMPRTPQQCAEQALKKNAVALSFDAAGIGAGFLPGGDLVVAGAQATVSVASGINSAAHGDAAGATLGVLGLPASFAGASAKFFGVGAKAIPGIGTAISALGTLNDAYSTYQDYQACLAGH